MVDETQIPDDGAEYYPAGEGESQEYTADYTTEYDTPAMDETTADAGRGVAEPARDLKSLLQNKRLLIPLGLILAVWLLYTFMGGGHKQAADSNAQITSAPQTATTTAAPATVPVRTMAQNSSTVSTLKKQVGEVKEANRLNEEKMAELQQQVGQLQGGMSVLNQGLTQINKNMQTLAQHVNGLILAQKHAKAAKVHHVAKPKPPVYHVRAIVPGRAWLVSETGDTVTVKIGDSLWGYGRISAIDPEQGTVGTTGGPVIQYGANDS